MEAAQMDELTSGASTTIIPVFRSAIPSYRSPKQALILFYSTFLCFLFLLLHRHRRQASPSTLKRRSVRFRVWKEEEDTVRRRALAEAVQMLPEGGDGDSVDCRCSASLFFGPRRNALFCRSWFPAGNSKSLPPSPAMSRLAQSRYVHCHLTTKHTQGLVVLAFGYRGIIIIIHGLNEHGGRYAHFAKQLTACNFGVYAMDWTGHGGSDGLHCYVPSLDHVVADTGALLEKVKLENPDTPCFLFGHSTGGAVVLKAASYPQVEQLVEGIILTSPALRVKPAHPVIRVMLHKVVIWQGLLSASLEPDSHWLQPPCLPGQGYQFKGANRRDNPVSRDPAQLLAKYSDPLVYTGPVRVRTGHEVLRISSHLTKNFKSGTVPFLVLHGTADRVTDPLASRDLFNEAASELKDIKLYDGLSHNLLLEPEHEEIGRDIINWIEKTLQ